MLHVLHFFVIVSQILIDIMNIFIDISVIRKTKTRKRNENGTKTERNNFGHF